MKVEIGKYYRLKPNDWYPIIGKCIGKSEVSKYLINMNSEKDPFLFGQLKKFLMKKL